MEELWTQLQPLVISACVTIITGVATWVGVQIKQVVKEKVKDEQTRKIVETTCRYVNQLYNDLEGPAKLEEAKKAILEQLNEKGITITELELRVMIEAAVNGFKGGYQTPALPEPVEPKLIEEKPAE